MNMFPWKILLLSYIEKYGGDKIFYLKQEKKNALHLIIMDKVVLLGVIF